MSHMVNQSMLTPVPSDLQTVDFGIDKKEVILCSKHKCPNGHEWPVRVAVVKCPGCQNDMLALMMVQCPVCNEPTSNSFLRIDHLPQGGAIMPLCKGGGSLAELLLVELRHEHAQSEQNIYKDREVISKV